MKKVYDPEQATHYVGFPSGTKWVSKQKANQGQQIISQNIHVYVPETKGSIRFLNEQWIKDFCN